MLLSYFKTLYAQALKKIFAEVGQANNVVTKEDLLLVLEGEVEEGLDDESVPSDGASSNAWKMYSTPCNQ